MRLSACVPVNQEVMEKIFRHDFCRQISGTILAAAEISNYGNFPARFLQEGKYQSRSVDRCGY